jgi:hypothetical protein
VTGNTGGTSGRDPNAYVNAAGLLPDLGSAVDRPQAIVANLSYQIPKIEAQVSGNYLGTSGYTYAPQTTVRLPQGTITVNVAPPDRTYTLPFQNNVDMRIAKDILKFGRRRVELTLAVENVLQSKAVISIVSQNMFAATFGQPSSYVKPREAYLVWRVYF